MKKGITDNKVFLSILILLCALCWGFSYLGTALALKFVNPSQVLALRWTVASLVFVILALFKVIKINYKGKNLKLVLAVGIFQPCFYTLLETIGVKLTTTSESSIFVASIPVFVLIFGAIVYKQKFSKRTVFAIIIALLGVIICIGFSPNFSIGGKGLGYLALLGAVTSGAFYIHNSAIASKEFSAVEITFGISLMGALFFNLLSLIEGNGFSEYVMCAHHPELLGAAIFLGVFCSCFCFLVYNLALGKMNTAIASNVVTNTTTAVGVLAGCIFAGDPFGWYTVLGLALTITGICISSMEDSSVSE